MSKIQVTKPSLQRFRTWIEVEIAHYIWFLNRNLTLLHLLFLLVSDHLFMLSSDVLWCHQTFDDLSDVW